MQLYFDDGFIVYIFFILEQNLTGSLVFLIIYDGSTVSLIFI